MYCDEQGLPHEWVLEGAVQYCLHCPEFQILDPDNERTQHQ